MTKSDYVKTQTQTRDHHCHWPGSERDPSGFIASGLDQLLNARLRKWTLITTNLSLREIAEKVDTRIASRMLREGNTVIEINAPDFNLRTK